MDFRYEPAGSYARVLAVASLALGLADAARLLGVSAGSASPIGTLGAPGFITLFALCLARLFAAVGLWIHARWGAVLLATAIAAEVGLYLAGSNWVSLTLIGFVFKLAILLATIALLVLARYLNRRHVPD